MNANERTRNWLAAIVVLAVCQVPTWAQNTVPKIVIWNAAGAASEQYYGVLGEISRPGVYSSAQAATLQDVITAAGGLSPTSSPSIRIVRGDRGGQTVFYSPQGRDPLHAGDFVVVDPLAAPMAPGAGPSTVQPRGVWIGLLGVSNRPVVVPLDSDWAQLPTLMQALGQSPQLARSAQVLLPRHVRMEPELNSPLPSGTIVALPPSLLVAANLPAFPPAQPLTLAAPAPPTTAPFLAMAPAVPAAEPAQPSYGPPPGVAAQQGPLVPLPPELPPAAVPRTSVFDRELSASTMPYSRPSPSETPANTASMPAPGSQLEALLRPQTPVKPTPPPPPREEALPLTALESNSASADEADLVGELGAETIQSEPASSTFSLWQMLGIGGTVASLVGVALGTRHYLDRLPPPVDMPAAIARRTTSRIEMPQAADLDEDDEPTQVATPAPPVAQPVGAEKPAPVSKLSLADLLRNVIPIDREAPELPAQMVLQGTSISAEREWRLDEAAELPLPAPHIELPHQADPTPIMELDRPAASEPPKPHFRPVPLRERLAKMQPAPVAAAPAEQMATVAENLSNESVEPAMAVAPAAPAVRRRPERAPALTAGDLGKTPFERALSQLQRGRRA